MVTFKDIPKHTSAACYHVNVSLDSLKYHIERYVAEFNLQLSPDFQRGHVWSDDKRIAYVEFLIKGGQSSKSIYFNMPYWMSWRQDTFDDSNCMVLVDGKQRIEAVMQFIDNKIPVFGHLYSEYKDPRYISTIDLDFYVHDLRTRKEVLQWYLDLNTGGVVHTTEEIEKVKKLLEKETNK